MTTRETTLILRLAAAEIANEPYSVASLRHELRILGWSAAALDAAVGRIKEVIEVTA